MISFIIIGRNEGKTLKKTIDSVLEYVKYNNLNEYDIIYIDSKSSDNSIKIASSFNKVKIFEITGEMNAAIARNIGANEAKGDVFIFLDADMEIQKKFHKNIFTDDKLIYPFVSGQLENIFYDKQNKKVDSNLMFPKLNKDIYVPTTGGYFIITRELWFSVEGMRTKYRRSQDLDLGLRLAKKGTLLLRKKELFVTHHTIHYQNTERMWKMLFDGSLLYGSSLLIRDHILNKYLLKRILRTNYTIVIAIFSILLSFISFPLILIYPLILLLKVLTMKKIKNNASIFKLYIYLFTLDITSLIAFFIFFPKTEELVYRIK